MRTDIADTLKKTSHLNNGPKVWPRSTGGGTWPMFGYRGAAEGLKTWSCLGQKKSKIHTLSRTTPSILGPCLGQRTFYIDWWPAKDRQISDLRYMAKYRIKPYLTTTIVHYHTLFRTDSHKIIYPVQDREAKNHTLSSGTSPYSPYAPRAILAPRR